MRYPKQVSRRLSSSSHKLRNRQTQYESRTRLIILPKTDHPFYEYNTNRGDYVSEILALQRFVPGYVDGMMKWLSKRFRRGKQQLNDTRHFIMTGAFFDALSKLIPGRRWKRESTAFVGLHNRLIVTSQTRWERA